MLKRDLSQYLGWSFAVCALIGFLLVLASTPDGASTSPDSLTYLSTARNLLVGQGVTQFNGQPLTLWAPLYSVLLAGIFALGDLFETNLNILQFVRFAHALLFAITILTTGLLFRRFIRSQALILIALAAVVLAYPLIFVAAFVWSEALFIWMYVLFILLLDHQLRKPAWRTVAALSLIAGLASLQRYPGVLLIVVGGSALLLIGSKPLRKRLGYALAFGVTASLPIVLWLARNYSLTSTLTGKRNPSQRPLRTNISHTYDVLTRWFTPDRMGFGYYDAALVALVLIGLFLVYYYRRYGRITLDRLARLHTLPMILLVIIYPVFFVVNVTLIDFTPIDDRYLAPIYVFVMCLTFMLLDALVSWLTARTGSPRAAYLVIGVAALWLVVPVDRLLDELPTLKDLSAASQDTYRAWNDSDLMQRVREGNLDSPVYTNAPLPVLLYTGLSVEAVPKQLEGWSPPDNAAILIWFDTMPPCRFNRAHCIETDYTPSDLTGHVAPDPLVTATDGALYALQDREK